MKLKTTVKILNWIGKGMIFAAIIVLGIFIVSEALPQEVDCSTDHECQQMCYQNCYENFPNDDKDTTACWAKCEDQFGEVEMDLPEDYYELEDL